MVAYTNFYENIKEAEIRIVNTVILYDGVPYYVLCVTDHKSDGIFRVYLDPIGIEGGMTVSKGLSIPYRGAFEPSLGTRGNAMDKWMEAHPDSKVIRKMMNSPSFNKFRPFPLGMMNSGGSVTYVERQPTRKTEQGLTHNMVLGSRVSLNPSKSGQGLIDHTTQEFRACVMGEYPSASECLVKMKNAETTNDATAFNRDFAFVRGPVDMLFLAYKSDIIGVLPNSSFSSVKLGKKFLYTREIVESLNLFTAVTD